MIGTDSRKNNFCYNIPRMSFLKIVKVYLSYDAINIKSVHPKIFLSFIGCFLFIFFLGVHLYSNKLILIFLSILLTIVISGGFYLFSLFERWLFNTYILVDKVGIVINSEKRIQEQILKSDIKNIYIKRYASKKDLYDVFILYLQRYISYRKYFIFFTIKGEESEILKKIFAEKYKTSIINIS